ncbi:MAG: FG-GAP repeat domain-containing protein, partial [Akkermansiaceae bacterium]
MLAVPASETDLESIVDEIVKSEEFLESQRKPLKNFAHALIADAAPAALAGDMFAKEFHGNQLDKEKLRTPLKIAGSSVTEWTAEESLIAYPHGKNWKPFSKLLSGTEEYDFIKAYMIRGAFVDDDSFESLVGVQGRARAGNGQPWRAFRSKHEVKWTVGDKPQIKQWRIKSFEWLESPITIFTDVTATAIPDAQFRKEVEQSMHEEFFIDGYLGKPVSLYRSQKHLAPYLDRDALTLHPGLSVVDYDGDGWEDLYLTVRQGRNLLLKNQGNGTFRDATIEAKLAVPGLSNCSVFADFDNDGDPDLFLGRTLKPSLYFRNDGGVFTECSATIFNAPLPQMANSVTAVDYNQDGLLDIYISTYGMFGSSERELVEKNRPFLSQEEHDEYVKRIPNSHRYLDMVGPPNVLFVNRGASGFEIAPENPSLQFYKNSFQSSWSDFDDDGDPDLYIANDFAPDLLIRNDGKDTTGMVRFVNVNREVGKPQMGGFGMGVDWGDYDRDGREDLYVSNMFSKAGLRITAQVPMLDPRFHEFAEGNRLYRYNGKSFEIVSYPASPGYPV